LRGGAEQHVHSYICSGLISLVHDAQHNLRFSAASTCTSGSGERKEGRAAPHCTALPICLVPSSRPPSTMLFSTGADADGEGNCSRPTESHQPSSPAALVGVVRKEAPVFRNLSLMAGMSLRPDKTRSPVLHVSPPESVAAMAAGAGHCAAFMPSPIGWHEGSSNIVVTIQREKQARKQAASSPVVCCGDQQCDPSPMGEGLAAA
jgi:hypothetical protein